MKYSSRFFLYAPVCAFVLIFAGICLHWLWAARGLSNQIEALNGQALIPGVTLHYAEKKMAGFPFRLDAVFKDMEITVETRNGPARWRSEDFAFHRLAYGGRQEVFEAAGTQTLSWTNGNGESGSFEFLAGTLRASAVEDTGGVARFDFDMFNLSSDPFQAARLQFHIRRRDGDTLQFVATADGIKLATPTGFGDVMKSLRLDGRFSQATAFDALRNGMADWRQALEIWRGRNGTLQLGRSQIAWTNMDMDISGAMSLDENHRPVGALNLKVGDALALTEETTDRGVVKGANDGLAGALLNQLEESTDESGDVAVTLFFRDGLISADQTPVTALEPLY